MKTLFLTGSLMALVGVGLPSRASMTLHLSIEHHLRLAEAVCRGTVVRVECFKDAGDGHLYTRTQVRVNEVFKGRFPAVVTLTHRGGTWGRQGELDGWAPQFNVGEERLLFLARQRHGRLQALDGSASAPKLRRQIARDFRSAVGDTDFAPDDAALLQEVRLRATQDPTPGIDVTDQGGDDAAMPADPTMLTAAAPGGVTNLLVSGGISSRFLAADRGEPIPYLVDADALPPGLTLTQAVNAVKAALNAWAAVTTLTFTFEGVQSFGMPAVDVAGSGGKIRIQLHDLYGVITGPTTLGQGGRWTLRDFTSAGWGTGGSVKGNEFDESSAGYLTVKHTQSSLTNLATFTEVLCHELGHVLSQAHSSEVYPESNLGKREAMMYYLVHADGRGATLGSWDPPVIRQVHPPGNTPPYTYGRVMDIITLPSGAPNLPGVNEVQLRGYDLQSTNLTMATNEATAGTGTFSLAGRVVRFTPNAPYNTSRLEPADGSYYDRIAFRFSDGTNAAPYGRVRVISHSPDRYPSGGGDGIPDSWMTTYWGNPNPAAGANRGATADYDGDGLTNFQEYQLGTSPINANSKLRLTRITSNSLEWEAKPWELYEVPSSTNLPTWTRTLNPVLPTNSPAAITGLTHHGAKVQFFRVLKVP